MKNIAARLISDIRSYWSGPITSNSPEIARLWASPPTSTGVAVTEQTALNYSAVWAAVSLISSQVASLPLILYKRLPNGGKDRMARHPLHWLLHDEPNSEMTSFVFRETLTAHVLSWGNGYAEIERDGAGRPIGLWPLTPDRVTPVRDKRTLALKYHVTDPNGGQAALLDPQDMLHIPGLGFDGTVGYDVISKARESIGVGMATERFGGAFFGNGATFGGVLEHPGKLSPAAQKLLTDQIEAKHGGLSKAHRFIILQEAMKYTQLGVPPEAAQFLESRKFQVIEVCRWFNIPPHKLRDLERATFSNIEQQAIEFVTDTLRPWLIKWEQEIQRKLIPRLEQGIQFAEHLVDGLLRGDIASRYAAYAVGRQWGWLSPDDVRERENMNPLPDKQGEMYLVPTNMAPANRINAIIDKQVAPTPVPVAPVAPKDPASADPAPARALEALREELAAAQVRAAEHIARAEEHLARAAAAETTAARLPGVQAEADTLRAAAEEAQREVARLNALIVVAGEHEARLSAERAAALETAAKAGEQLGREVDRAFLAETARATASVDAAEARTLVTVRDGSLAEAQAQIVALEVAQRAMVPATDLEAATGETERQRSAAVAASREAERLADVAAEASTLEAAARAAREDADRSAAEALVAAEAERARASDAVAAAQRDSAAREAAEAGQRQAEQDLLTARAATAAADTALAAQRDAERQRMTGVIAAHRALIVDAMGRMIAWETDKARRNQATPEKLRRWMTAFYQEHEHRCVDGLLPAIRVHLAWAQSADDPLTVTRRLVRAHVAESVRQLRNVADDDPDDLHVSLERLLQRWEDRAAAVADEILREEIEHVRDL